LLTGQEVPLVSHATYFQYSQPLPLSRLAICAAT
jgi:hypothetical protein